MKKAHHFFKKKELKKQKLNKQEGFTLLEIIIAMAIVAIAVLGISKAVGEHARVAAELEKSVVASWVASNVMADLRYKAKTEKVKQRSYSESVEMGGIDWRVKISINETPVEKVYKVTVKVHDQQKSKKNGFAELVSAIANS